MIYEGWQTAEGHKSGTASGSVIPKCGRQQKVCSSEFYESLSLGIYHGVPGICCNEPLPPF
jgi:hypothetical protein